MGPAMLVVELPSARSVVTEFTRRNPHASVDIVQVPGPGSRASASLEMVMLVRGAAPEACRALAAEMERAAGAPVATRSWTERDGWLCSCSFPAAGIPDPALASVHRFLDTQGLRVRWTRVEDGVLHVCAQLPTAVAGQGVAARAQGWFEADGVDADVSVGPLPTGSLSVWKDLVDAIGAADAAGEPAKRPMGGGAGAEPGGPSGRARKPVARPGRPNA